MDDLWSKTKTQPSLESGGLPGWPDKPSPTSPGVPATPASSTVASGVSTSGELTRDQYWKNKEVRDLEKERVYREEDIPAIRRGNAYAAAAQLASTALAHDVLSFGSVAKGKKLDMYLGYVDLIAEHVFSQLSRSPDDALAQDPAEGGDDE
jgi:hypothetical protein